MSPARAWRAFWFPPVPVRRLAAFRIVICGFALADLWFVSGFISRYARVDQVFYRPLLVVRPLPRLGPELTSAVHVVLCVALALALVGLFTRAALLVAAPLYLWWWATYYSFGAVHHGRIPVTVALLVMAVAPAGRAYSLDARRWRRRAVPDGTAPGEERDELAGWALRVMMVLVVLAYDLAAFAKLRVSGPGWVTSGALESIMLHNGTPPALALVRHPGAVHLMAALTLVLESTAWVMFLRGRARDAYALSAALFHLGTLLVLNINFLGLVLAYLAFYDLEVGVDRLVAWWRRWLAGAQGRRGIALPR